MHAGGGPSRSRRARSRRPAQRNLAFAAGAAIPVYLAMDGGAYSVEVRNQAALILWWALALMFAFGVLPVARPARLLAYSLLAAGALFAWMALSLVWAESAELAWNELTRFAGYGALLVLIVFSVHKHTYRQATSGLILALGGIVVVALLSRLAPGLFPQGSLTTFFAGDRLLYPLGYWNALASWAAMTIVAGVAWSAHARGWHRGASLAVVPVATVVLTLTYSRGGIIVAAIGVAAVIWWSRHRWTAALHTLAAVAAAGIPVVVLSGTQVATGVGTEGAVPVAAASVGAAAACWLVARATATHGVDELHLDDRHARRLKLGLAVMAGTIVVFGSPGLLADAGESFSSSGDQVSDQGTAARLVGLDGIRSDLWGSAIDAFAAKPALGVGPGAFEFWWARESSADLQLKDAHSLYLETLAELGAFGLLLMIALITALALAAARSRRYVRRSRDTGAIVALLGIATVFTVHAGIDWIWEVGAVTSVGLAAFALASAASAGARRTPRRRRRFGVRTVVAVSIAVLGGVIQIPALVAQDRLASSEDHLRADRLSSAAELAEEAKQAEPWAASPVVQASRVALADGRIDDARVEVMRAIDLEPTNWRHRLLLARIELDDGDSAAANEALEDLVRLNPSLADEVQRIREEVLLSQQQR